MWLAARAENIGMGWISFFNPEDIEKILHIPENIKLIAYLTLGKLKEYHDKPELEEKQWEKRHSLSEYIFMNKWDNKPDNDFVNVIRNSKI